jgi:iron complex outermembrane receptor protein
MEMKLLLITTASAIAMMSTPAWAQSPPSGQAAPALASAQGEVTTVEDIIVTATRQSTALSKTPIAMTAITGESLRSAGITDSRALTSTVPNVAITDDGNEMRVSIRGVTSSDTTEKGDPSAAYLMDGIYIARPADQQGSFYDIARVEVLRGPQGTLYGRNTTAGVVNVITNRPSSRTEGSFDAAYGNFDAVNVTGMYNIPVGENFGLRLAANYDRIDSFLKKGVPSSISLDPARDVFSGRVSFGGKTDKIDLVVRADYSHLKGSTSNSLPLYNFFPDPLAPTVDPRLASHSASDYRTLPYGELYDNRRDTETYGVQGELTYDLGSSALTYLGSYRKTDRLEHRDQLFFSAMQTPTTYTGQYDQQSHEVRLSFGSGAPLHGQVGGYYFREESAIEYNLGPPLSTVVGGPDATAYIFIQDPTVSSSLAAFGQLTYDITPDLHLTGGLRQTKDKKSREGLTLLDVRDPVTSVVTRNTLNQNIADKTFDKLTWKLGVDYDAEGLGLLYASVSTGYKAGGFNDGCITGQGIGCSLDEDSLYYQPETLTAYEAGAKLRLADGALALNLSAFHYDYKNLQISQITFVGNTPSTLIRNAATAKVDGIEAEAIVRASAADRIELNANYTNARYDSFAPDPVNYPNFTFDGKQLDHAPKFTAAAAYAHTFRLANGGDVEAKIRSAYSSAYYMQDLNNLSQFRQPSYTKTDVTVTYTAPEGRYYLQAFGKNLENEITIAAAASGLLARINIEAPRTFGVRAGVSF